MAMTAQTMQFVIALLLGLERSETESSLESKELKL